jgi:hypothetical protein
MLIFSLLWIEPFHTQHLKSRNVGHFPLRDEGLNLQALACSSLGLFCLYDGKKVCIPEANDFSYSLTFLIARKTKYIIFIITKIIPKDSSLGAPVSFGMEQ